jgi:hypothetical protein
MATFFKPVAGQPDSSGVFFGHVEDVKGNYRAPWVMLPKDSPGLEVELVSGTNDQTGKPYPITCAEPTVVSVSATSMSNQNKRVKLTPVNPGKGDIVVQVGRAAEVKLEVGVLASYEVHAAFFLVANQGRKTGRTSASITQLVANANSLLRPLNVKVTVASGPQAYLSITDDLGKPIAYPGQPAEQRRFRYVFCKSRNGQAHFNVFCVSEMLDPEDTFRQEGFCLIEDGDEIVTPAGLPKGAYCLAHAVGHLLWKGQTHSDWQGDLMYPDVHNGGSNICRDDAVSMNDTAAHLGPCSSFACVPP